LHDLGSIANTPEQLLTAKAGMGRNRLSRTLKNIFRYDDYRSFLADYFEEQKATGKSFSHRLFAQKAGFASHSFCPLVIKGERSLTGDSIEKIIRALPLKDKASDYFRALVQYNQTKSFDVKRDLFEQLELLRDKTRFSKLDKKAYPFFDSWYYPVIRALAAYSDWAGDYRKLAKMVKPQITADEARTAVAALVLAGMLVKVNETLYRVHSKKITTADVPAIVRNKNRRDILQQCIGNSEEMTPDERYLAYTTLATTEKTYKKIAEYLDGVRENVIDMVMADEGNDRVYELVFNVVPFSEKYHAEK
jgi:uncharacterized protein (TIGR02147 family)